MDKPASSVGVEIYNTTYGEAGQLITSRLQDGSPATPHAHR